VRKLLRQRDILPGPYVRVPTSLVVSPTTALRWDGKQCYARSVVTLIRGKDGFVEEDGCALSGANSCIKGKDQKLSSGIRKQTKVSSHSIIYRDSGKQWRCSGSELTHKV